MGLETRENHEVDYLYEAKNLSNKILEPWKMKYIRESNDKKYDIYTYKLTLWWNKWGIKSKFESQIWKWKEWTKLTSENWTELTKNSFEKWEVVYLRVPKTEKKTEKSNETQKELKEMTYEDLKNLSDEKIKELFNLIKDENRAEKATKKDKKWMYLTISGKKIYFKDLAFLTQQSWNYNYNWLFLHVTQYDWAEIPQAMVLWIKKWNNVEWIYIWEETKNKIYRWKLANDTYWPIPAKK